jgi:hypothetical protein
MVAGVADRLAVGAGAGSVLFTETVTLSVTLPPLPVQVIEYGVVAVGLTSKVPLVVVLILSVQLAEHVVVSVEIQSSVADCP